jgi:ribonuclease HI
MRSEVEQVLGEARESGNERLEQLAERFLRRISARGRA